MVHYSTDCRFAPSRKPVSTLTTHHTVPVHHSRERKSGARHPEIDAKRDVRKNREMHDDFNGLVTTRDPIKSNYTPAQWDNCDL